jgi:hypothetical protein
VNLKEGAQELVEYLGCSQKEAEALLDITEGDVSDAMKVISLLGKRNIVVLKVRFEADSVKMYGLIFIIYNLIHSELERLEVVVTKNKWQTVVQIDESWDVFEREVMRAVSSQDNLKKSTRRLRDEIESAISEGRLLGDTERLVMEEEKENLSHIIGKVLDVTQLKIQVSGNKLSSYGFSSPEDFEDEFTQEVKEGEQVLVEKEEALGPAGRGFIIPAVPVVSPVSGLPVHELSKGAQVLVHLPDSTLGKYLANVTGSKTGDVFQPIVVPIEEIGRIDSETTDVVVRFAPFIIARMRVGNDVRLRIVSDGKTQKRTGAKRNTEEGEIVFARRIPEKRKITEWTKKTAIPLTNASSKIITLCVAIFILFIIIIAIIFLML